MLLTESFVNLSVYVGNASNNDKLFERTVNLENKIENEQYYRVKSEKEIRSCKHDRSIRT